MHQSPTLLRVVLTPKSLYGRQDPLDPEARKSTDHQSEQSVKYRETCRSLLEDTRRKRPGESQRWKETCRGDNRPERRLESQGNRQKTDSTVRASPEPGIVNTGFEQD